MPSRPTKCCANWKPTRSRSRCPPPSRASSLKSSPPKAATVAAKARLAIVSEGADRTPAPAPPRREVPSKATPALQANVAADYPAAEPIAAPQGCRGRPRREERRWRRRASPAIRSQPTGRDGRVMKEDVARAVAGQATAAPAVASAVPAPAAAPRAPVPADDAAREERVKMTRLRATIAKPSERRPEHRRDADHL